MQKYWWVNHKQTAKQEVGDGYLWSPKLETGGNRSQFYNNMTRAQPGDLVLSYATQIASVGVVKDYAVTSPKPDFGKAGAYWNNEGWLLPIEWQSVPRPIKPKEYLEQLAPLLPLSHSPLNGATGNGNQKAYLAEISQELFEAVGRAALIDFQTLYVTSDRREIDSTMVEKIEKEIVAQIDGDPNLSKTEKLQLSKARVGQGQFRDNVLRQEPKCRMTGISNPALLTASHIKPWRLCISSTERLDGANGLMLTAHVDQLFDRGLISFQDNGDVMISSKLPTSDLAALHLSEISNVGPFSADQAQYLDYHRIAVFLLER
jgi:hypothetical protein